MRHTARTNTTEGRRAVLAAPRTRIARRNLSLIPDTRSLFFNHRQAEPFFNPRHAEPFFNHRQGPMHASKEQRARYKLLRSLADCCCKPCIPLHGLHTKDVQRDVHGPCAALRARTMITRELHNRRSVWPLHAKAAQCCENGISSTPAHRTGL